MISDLNDLWMCLWCTEFSESKSVFDRFRFRYRKVPKVFGKMLLDEAWLARLICRGMEAMIIHTFPFPNCEMRFGFSPCASFKAFGLDPAAFDRSVVS